MRLLLERWDSPIAPLLLVTDEHCVLRALDYADYEPRMNRLLRIHYGACTVDDAAAPASITAALKAYFDGDMDALADIPIATGGTTFQRKVWGGLRKIPVGATITYGKLAANIGHPGAGRAVGAANGANPIAIIVPCHRVIGTDGTLTGYAGGLSRKTWLLEHEVGHRRSESSLFARS